MARSTDASMEMLRATGSSPSVMVHDTSMPDLAAADGEEEDTGVYADSYKNATWIYIGDTEEMHVWQKPETKGEDKGMNTFILNVAVNIWFKSKASNLYLEVPGSNLLHGWKVL